MKIKPLLKEVDTNDFLRSYLRECGVRDVDNYLKADLACCDSPWDYPNMQRGVDRLKKAIDNDDVIGIVVD